MKVKGKILPLRDNVIVSDMNFDEQKTSSGIVITSDNAKTSGIKPRWARVFAVGPEQTEINVGDWICIEHGRWTRTIEHETETGDVVELRMVENKSILLSAAEKPNDVTIAS